MERINDVIVRENVANCVNVAEELKQSAQTFKIKLENFSSEDIEQIIADSDYINMGVRNLDKVIDKYESNYIICNH